MQERKPLKEKTSAKKLTLKADIMPSEKPASFGKEQERLNYGLWNAVKDCDKAGILRLIKAGADITAKDGMGRTSLHWAVFHEDTEILQFIISTGNLIKVMGKGPFDSFMKSFGKCVAG
jgi:hypothetical protein